MSDYFIKIISAIILAFAVVFNTIGGWIGVGDIIPTEPRTTQELVTTEISEPTTATISPTASTTNRPTTTTTTAAPTTTTTTAPTTTTTTAPTTELGPVIKTATELGLSEFGGSNDDIFKSVYALSDGSFVACGTTKSIDGTFAENFNENWVAPYAFIVKLSKTAQVEWVKTYGSTSAGVYIEDITVLSGGNIVAVGYSEAQEYAAQNSTAGACNAFVITLNQSGTQISRKSFGGTGSDIFYCVTPSLEGFAVGGKTSSTDGDFEGLPESGAGSAIIINFDSSGGVLWKRYLSGNKGGSVEGISADSSGNIFVSCLTASTNGEFASFEGLTGGYIDTVAIKYDYTGEYQWNFVISSSGRDEFACIAADEKGGCVIGGQYEMVNTIVADGTLAGIHNCGGIDALVFRLNADGTRRWVKILSGFNDDYITDIALVNGGFAVAGYTNSSNREFAGIGNQGNNDGFVAFITPAGATVSTFSQAGSAFDAAASVAYAADGGVIVVGRTKSSNGDFSESNANSFFTGYASRYRITAR